MNNTNEQNKNEKKKLKRKILIGGGVVILVGAGAYLIGKKVGARNNANLLSSFFGDIPDGMNTVSISYPAPKTDIGTKIDEELFTDIAMQIEEALLTNGIEQFHLDSSWKVADGVLKTLDVTIDTVTE